MHNMLDFFGHGSCVPSTIIKLKESMKLKQDVELMIKCTEKPKLRTFVTFKDFGPTPVYLLKPISFVQKKFIAQLRLSALPIKIETGRYERPKLAVHERLCPSCNDGQSIENEEHFMLTCPKHSFRRIILYSKIENITNFSEKNNIEKLKFLFNDASVVKASSQYILDSFAARSA